MIYLILSLIIGVSAATIVWAIFMIEKRLSPNTLRRLERIKRKSNIELPEEKKQFNLNLNDVEYKIPVVGKFLKKYKITQKIKDLIEFSGSKMHVDTFIFLTLGCSSPFLMFLFTDFKLMALFSIFAAFIPTFYLKYLINKRFLEFSKQFPDALSLMASSLRAGHPLFSAMDIVTTEMPKPVSDVFSNAQSDISLGIDTKEAFYGMTEIMPQSIDLKFFITAVLIQKEVGGNLAELLDSLAGTIRERFKLLGQLRVQTAQTRLSGAIIGFVPIMVGLVIFFMNPEYIKPLFDTPDGQIALFIAIVLIIVGFISIKKISDIEI